MSPARRATGALYLLLVAQVVAPTPSRAAFGELLRAPFPAVTALPGPDAVGDVLLQLEGASRRREEGDAYDWVPPWLCVRTTRELERRIDAGELAHPGLARAMVVQFFEVYAANANALVTRRPVAPHWAKAAAVSRTLGRLDASAVPRRKAAALAQTLSTLYAHMLTDLPLVLVVLERRLQPRPTEEALARTFREVEAIFPTVIAETMGDTDLSPSLLARAWPHLPGWLQRRVTGEGGAASLGGVFLSIRRLAWLRFRWMRRRSQAALVEGLPTWGVVTPLIAPRDAREGGPP